ncbi:uncharacterized protein LOC141610868 [Silene latifolia]|uniref:uncharacterized protein LOC141610868 n=1 Tax=Silene latifolia TaxID=37657 RepID=UPI003D7776BC
MKKKPKKHTKMSALPKSETPTPTAKPFTHLTDDSAFTDTHYFIDTTTVHLIRPPLSHSSSRSWITARETTKNHTVIFRHPLTSKPYSVTLPRNPDFKNLQPSTLTNSYSFRTSASLDKLLPLPFPRYDFNINTDYYTVLVLYGGGELKGCPSNPRSVTLAGSGQRTWPWVRLTLPGEKFDDIVEFEGKVYAVDRQGLLKLINYYKTVKTIRVGRTVLFQPVFLDSGRFGWRKRFVVDGGNLYLVVRMEEERFRVYKLRMEGKRGFWEEVRRFGGDKVLFMARDYCFFRRASRKFPGREYRNCIVFSEAAFPQYGNNCWEFTQCGDRQLSEDDIAVFCLDDQRFAREGEGEGEKSGFPKIDWSPPDWILNVSSFPADAFKKHSGSESCSSQSEREPNEDEKLDADSGDKNGEEVQSRLKDSKSKDEDEQEEMESDFGSLGQDQRWVEFDSDSPDQEDEKMQSDSNSQEKEDEVMHSKEANTEVGASLHVDVCHVSSSLCRPEPGTTVTRTLPLSATEQEITRTLLSLDGGNYATEEETLRKSVTELVHRACASSPTVRHGSDSATAKFEGFDIGPDSVSTLEKIWQKHGNIVENCAVRNTKIIGKALESLATMVHILDDNSALSLSNSQVDYLVSTLLDLRYIRFKVDWLIPFVENAEKLHKSKPLLESLNNLNQLSCQAMERRAVLLDELSKLDVEENKRQEELAKVFKMIPFCGQVNFDKPLGPGLT